MTECDACKKNVRVTKSLSLLVCPELCVDCFEYITTDDTNIDTRIDEDVKG